MINYREEGICIKMGNGFFNYISNTFDGKNILRKSLAVFMGVVGLFYVYIMGILYLFIELPIRFIFSTGNMKDKINMWLVNFKSLNILKYIN